MPISYNSYIIKKYLENCEERLQFNLKALTYDEYVETYKSFLGEQYNRYVEEETKNKNEHLLS